jgi:catechol 2,3-dioxygenase-like lactoylglutathione lyase family enzyme
MLTNAPIVVSIACTDITVARTFYSDTLGLNEMEIPGPQDARVMYTCGNGTMLFIYQRETPPIADHTVAGWIVADVDATADFLISRGVTLKTYPDMPDMEWDERGVGTRKGSKSAWFTDPDGNIMALAAMA